MPVPVFGPDRPSGQVEPAPDLSGLTELRVHGVGGTTPGDLLADLRPQQVAGDRLAGFYRTADVTAGGVRRHVEAYSWGGLTSRSGTRVLWLLLLPFMLANLAGWMCSPRARRSPLARWLVRVAALALTLDGLVLAVLMSVDLAGYQCGTDPACRDRHWWTAPLRWPGIAGQPARQVLVGAVPVVAVVVLLAFLSYRSRERYEAVRPPVAGQPAPSRGRSAAALPDGLADPGFWDGARSTKRLGRAHTSASIGLLAFAVLHGVGLALGPAARWEAASLVLQVLALAAVAGAVALLAVEDVADGWGAGLLAGSAAVGLLAAVLTALQPAGPVPDGQLPGLRDVVTATYGGLVVVMALVLVTTVAYGRVRGSFRWAAPFVVLALAVAVLNVVLLGLLVTLARLAGSVSWTTGPGPAGSVSVWPVVRTALPYLTVVPIALTVLFGAVEAARWWWAGRRGLAELTEEYGALAADPVPAGPLGVWHRTTVDDRLAWWRKVARARRSAVAGTDVSLLLSGFAVAGTVFILYAEWKLLHRDEATVGDTWLLGLSTTIAVALPALLLATLRWGWRSLAGRRLIGVLWDVGTFWPRSFHPYAPPSYAERAVPDLQRRMWWLHDSGGTVLLAAHSQGTVLAAAALLTRSARAPGSRVGLVTFGSPLGKLYGWGFPAWVDEEILAGLADPDTEWVNVHYPTDHIGGPVFASAAAGIDRRLPDPASCRYLHGQPPPAIGGHSGYWRDPAMWTIVDALATRLATPGSGPGRGRG